MNHPNLSKEVNDNIAKSEYLGGKYLKDIQPGDSLQVQTRNTLYTILRQDSGQLFIRGGKITNFTPVNIHGSTWGGSMLKVGFIGIDMHLEFTLGDGSPGNEWKTYTTSTIKEIF